MKIKANKNIYLVDKDDQSKKTAVAIRTPDGTLMTNRVIQILSRNKDDDVIIDENLEDEILGNVAMAIEKGHEIAVLTGDKEVYDEFLQVVLKVKEPLHSFVWMQLLEITRPESPSEDRDSPEHFDQVEEDMRDSLMEILLKRDNFRNQLISQSLKMHRHLRRFSDKYEPDIQRLLSLPEETRMQVAISRVRNLFSEISEALKTTV